MQSVNHDWWQNASVYLFLEKEGNFWNSAMMSKRSNLRSCEYKNPPQKIKISKAKDIIKNKKVGIRPISAFLKKIVNSLITVVRLEFKFINVP